MMFITSDSFARGRRLSMIARSASSRRLASARARTTPPTSGDTTIRSGYFCFHTSPSNTGDAYTLSTGMSKNPWIWSACRSTVRTRFTPAETIRFATSLAVIGTRAARWRRSCRAYPKYGTTAVMRPALARRRASAITSNSMRLSLVGGQVDCTMKTSRPRTFSINSIATSPSLNLLTWALPSGRVRRAAILCTSCGLAFPANTIILPADTVPPRVTWSTDHHLNRILGWGARDRTWEWRDQNPLPYRLATPQIQNLQGLSPLRFEPHHQRRSVAAPGHETSP